MKPSSPLSLLLFIHLTSAAPIPSLSSECQLSSSCQHDILGNPTLGIPRRRFLDPYFSRPQLSPQVATPHRKELVDEPLAATTEDPSPKLFVLSAAPPGEKLSHPAPQDPSQDAVKPSPGEIEPSNASWEAPQDPMQDWQRPLLPKEPSEDDTQQRPILHPVDEAALTWSEKVKRLYPWIGSREYGELLVVGIVILFFVSVVVWEVVGRSNGWSVIFQRPSRRWGPIYLDDSR